MIPERSPWELVTTYIVVVLVQYEVGSNNNELSQRKVLQIVDPLRTEVPQ